MKLFREILFPLIAVLAAFIVGGIVVALIGDSPFQTYRLLIGSAFSWPDGIGYTLFYATPLIFTRGRPTVYWRLCRGLGRDKVWRLVCLGAAADVYAGRHRWGRDLGRHPGTA